MSDPREQRVLLAVLGIVILALAGGFWWRNLQKSRIVNDANTEARLTSDLRSGSTIANDLVGSLDLNVHSDRGGHEGWSIDSGWVFINSEFQGTMPLHIQPLLVPGSYEIRVVMAEQSTNGGFRFLTVSWTANVERHNSTKADEDLTAISGAGCGRPANPATGLHCEQSRVLGNTYAASNMASDSESVRNLLNKEWEQFVESDEWKPVQSAEEYLDINPPMRRRVWIDLPSQLGGAREFDIDQLRSLKKWFAKDLEVRFAGKLPANGDRESQFLQNAIQQKKEWVGKMLQAMITRLEGAPEE